MQQCIFIESSDETFINSHVKHSIRGIENKIDFDNKYYKATVPLIFTAPETPEAVKAHVLIFEPGQDVVPMFTKYPQAEIRVLLLKAELSDLADKLHDVCVQVEAEVFRWEDDESGLRLLKILECHRWCETELSFEELLAEIHRVKDLCDSGSLSDCERKELAAATAVKFARLLDSEEF